jgi:MFS family permease
MVIVALVIGAALLGTRHSFGVFFNSMETEFGLSRATTSAIFSAYMLFSGLFSILGGWILDKKGPQFTVVLLGIFTGLSMLLSSQVHSVWQLYLTYSLILAAGTGEAFSIIGAFVSRWFQKKRGLALGVANMGGGLGGVVLAPFATYLIMIFNWRGAYIILGLITGGVVVILAFLLKRNPGEIGLLPDGEKPEKAGAESPLLKSYPSSGYTPREALRSRPFWLLFFIWLFLSAAVYLIINHIVPHALDVGIPSMAAASILSVVSGFYLLGGIISGVISDRIGRRLLSLVGAVIGAGAFLWLMWMPNNLWLFYAFAALFGYSWGSISTASSALVGDIYGMRSIGTILGWIVLGWFIGGAAGPAIGGYIYDIDHRYFFAFLMGAIAMLLVVLLVLWLPGAEPVKRREMGKLAGK